MPFLMPEMNVVHIVHLQLRGLFPSIERLLCIHPMIAV